MKVTRFFLAMLALIMAVTTLSCSLDLPGEGELTDGTGSRSTGEGCIQKKCYNLTVDYSKESDADGSIKSSIKNGTYAEGREVLVEAEVCKDYEARFSGWYDAPRGGNLVSTAEKYSFKLTGDTALYARFDLTSSEKYTFTIRKHKGSTAEGSLYKSSGSGIYRKGTQIVAVAETDANFICWQDSSGNFVSSEPVYRFHLTGNISLIARFDRKIPLSETVIFPDPALERYMRWKANKPVGPIMPEDVAEITRIQYITDGYSKLHKTPLTDLSGIEHLKALKRIYIADCNIANLDGLGSLKNLESVEITRSNVKDISGLAGAPNLKSLHLHENKISDISSLATLNRLTTVFMIHNSITDISPVANLSNLHMLALDHNKIDTLPSFSNLTSLPYLSLSYNRISDPAPLADLKKVKSLPLNNNLITDITSFIESPNYGNGNWISLSGNEIPASQIEALKKKGVTVY